MCDSGRFVGFGNVLEALRAGAHGNDLEAVLGHERALRRALVAQRRPARTAMVLPHAHFLLFPHLTQVPEKRLATSLKIQYMYYEIYTKNIDTPLPSR